MQPEPLDYFWSYRSHYCYLSIDRVIALETDYAVRIRFRPVYPIAIRNPDFFASIPRTGVNRWAYVMHDTERIAQRLSIPFAWPDPDPVRMDMQRFVVADEQPYIHRLTRLGVEAARQGKGLLFTRNVSRLIFGGTKHWDRDDHLAKAAAEAGLDLAAMDARIAADPDGYDAEIEANEAELADAGHWGVPTLAFRGEPFFGQDRIEDLKWRLEQSDLYIDSSE